MLDNAPEMRVDQLARACAKAGVELPEIVDEARERVAHIAEGRVQAETAYEAAKAKLADEVFEASADGAEKVCSTILDSDALRIEAMCRLHETEVMVEASRRASANALETIVAEGPKIHELLAAEFAERGKELARVAKKAPVTDLRDAEQVVRLGGSAAADAATGLEALARLDAVMHASRALARCGHGHTGPVTAVDGATTDILRGIEVADLDGLDTLRGELQYSGKASKWWTAVLHGFALKLASPAELESSGRALGEAWQAREDKRNPYRRYSALA